MLARILPSFPKLAATLSRAAGALLLVSFLAVVLEGAPSKAELKVEKAVLSVTLTPPRGELRLSQLTLNVPPGAGKRRVRFRNLKLNDVPVFAARVPANISSGEGLGLDPTTVHLPMFRKDFLDALLAEGNAKARLTGIAIVESEQSESKLLSTAAQQQEFEFDTQLPLTRPAPVAWAWDKLPPLIKDIGRQGDMKSFAPGVMLVRTRVNLEQMGAPVERVRYGFALRLWPDHFLLPAQLANFEDVDPVVAQAVNQKLAKLQSTELAALAKPGTALTGGGTSGDFVPKRSPQPEAAKIVFYEFTSSRKPAPAAAPEVDRIDRAEMVAVLRVFPDEGNQVFVEANYMNADFENGLIKFKEALDANSIGSPVIARGKIVGIVRDAQSAVPIQGFQPPPPPQAPPVTSQTPPPVQTPPAPAPPAPPAAEEKFYLAVDSDPPGADVYLDDDKKGQTPIELPDIPKGKHKLKLVKEGYDEKVVPIDLNKHLKFTGVLVATKNPTPVKPPQPAKTPTSAKEKPPDTPPQPPPNPKPGPVGRLTVQSTPAGADVFVIYPDGMSRSFNQTPTSVAFAGPGVYTIRIVLARPEGPLTVEEKVTMGAKSQSLQVDLNTGTVTLK
jgi:hypothetical protein